MIQIRVTAFESLIGGKIYDFKLYSILKNTLWTTKIVSSWKKQTESKELFIDEHYPLELFGALTISLCQHILYCTCKFHSLYAQQCANILRKNSYNVGFSQKLKG